MPRVHLVIARKDYPEHGIKKGDIHYTWSLLLGPRFSKTYRQLTRPTRSQLTTSEFLQAIYDIEDQLSSIVDPDDLQDIISSLNECADNEDSKYENMPEGLQQGATGQLIAARAQACRDAADELENIDVEFYEDGDETEEAWRERVLQEIHDVVISYE